MKVITYLAFTMLSIAIQFVVMDLIQEKLKIDGEEKSDLNVTSPNKLDNVLQQFTRKPQALYYRMPNERQIKRAQSGNTSGLTYSNSSIVSFETTTELSSTLFDFLYDENITVTDGSLVSATESLYTTTEFENSTEFILFGNNKTTTVQPPTKSQVPVTKDCKCNLLYKVCDINCCCDIDCTDAERDVFVCTENVIDKENSEEYCFSPFSYSNYLIGSNMDHLLCVVKSNVPEKRDIQHIQHNPGVIDRTFKWHTSDRKNFKNNGPVVTRKLYKYGDPVWLLRNSTLHYVDLPSTVVNNYCSDRQPIHFLKNQNIKCNVKLMDLEILRILNIVEETTVISMTEKSLNSSSMNCSTLHCTNWTTILCDEASCTKYNRSLHNPLCTESMCTHLALRVDYIFHYYTNKIMNATIKLFTRKVSPNVMFIEQEINVKFIIGNETVNIVELSGNPGYITGFPVIVSYAEGNHSDNFYNSSSKLNKYLSYPNNNNGECTQSMGDNYVLFGVNKRLKCRYYHIQRYQRYQNVTDICKNIQNNITGLLRIKSKITLSPFGNPSSIQDEDWIPLQVKNLEEPLYGKMNAEKAQFTCYNLVTRYSFVFTFAAVGEDRKILSGRIDMTVMNVTFSTEDTSAVVTVDTSFIDETSPAVYEYAAGPQLHFHLPSDFFFPFYYNKVCSHVLKAPLIVLVFIANLICKLNAFEQ